MKPQNRALAKLLVARSYQEGDFVLSSGRRSRFYFDCRLTTCFAEAMPLIGRLFLDEIRHARTQPDAVGGLTSGADPIALAIAQYSLRAGSPLNGFIVRRERKAHGARRWIEGCAAAGDRVAVVDDVVTSGGSVLRAVERCREEGLEVIQAVVLVDREEGGLEAIRAALPDTPVSAIFLKAELDALRAEECGRGQQARSPVEGEQ